MASQTSENTAQFAYQPLTQGGFPSIIDDNFHASMQDAVQGGQATQSYFDATNQTSDFWNAVADETITFADGVDPDGNPIVMASTGNVDLRLGAFYSPSASSAPALAAAASDPPPIVGIATVQTMNTTTNTSQNLSFLLTMVSFPVGITITRALFNDLIKPLYSNFTKYLQNSARSFQEAAQVEDPQIDPLEENEEAISEASGEAEEVGGELAEQGVEYMTIDWTSVSLEAAGLGVVIAIPMVILFIGHEMVNSVNIVNETDLSFTWSVLTQVHGSASVLPAASSNNVIPPLSYVTDAWGDETTVKCAYSADFQFINSSDLGSIGYVLNLEPSDGGTPAKIVVSIPWGSDNAIWLGQSDDDGQTIYDDHSGATGELSVSATFGNYQISVAITALSGETNGQYFYGVVGHITPA